MTSQSSNSGFKQRTERAHLQIQNTHVIEQKNCIPCKPTAHASWLGHLLHRTIYTTVFILAGVLVRNLEEKAKVWLSFRTGKGFWFSAAKDMARALGLEKTQALL